jgi:VWFA-related protein
MSKKRASRPTIKAKSTRVVFVLWNIVFFIFVGSSSSFLCGYQEVIRPQKPLQHEVSVTVKLIQVSVMDKRGQPVMDLKPEEFEVTDNGRVVRIDHFEKHVFGGPDEVRPAVAAVAETAIPPARPSRLNRKFFLVFDFAFLDQRSIPKAKKAALQFIDTSLQPSDEVTVVSYSPLKSLTIHEFRTTDHKKIRQVVENFDPRSVMGRAESLMDYWVIQLEMDRNDRDYPLPGPGKEGGYADNINKLRSQTVIGEALKTGYIHQVHQFTLALKNLAVALRGIPGQKNVLLFSNGIARQVLYGKRLGAKITLLEDMVGADEVGKSMSAYDDSLPVSSARDDFNDMTKEFKAANCKVYSINQARVLDEVAMDQVDVSNEGFDFKGDYSLRQFSSETGGKYYSNTMDYLKVAEDIRNITGAFYVLGYSINERSDGAFHRIKVKVRRKGCDVEAQQGYFNPKPFAEYTSFEKLLQLMDLALADNLQFAAPADLPFATLPVRVEGRAYCAGAALVSGEGMKAILGENTEAYFLAFDEQNNAISIKRFKLTEFEAGPAGASLNFVLPLKPGRYNCRIVFRNMLSGMGARGYSSLAIPEVADENFWIDPLLLLTERRNVAAVNATSGLTLDRLYDYDLKVYSPLLGDVPSGTQALLVAVRCSSGERGASDIAFLGTIFDFQTQTRTQIPLTVLSQSQNGGMRFFRLGIPLSNPASGQYQLDIIALENRGGRSVHASSTFIVK